MRTPPETPTHTMRKGIDLILHLAKRVHRLVKPTAPADRLSQERARVVLAAAHLGVKRGLLPPLPAKDHRLRAEGPGPAKVLKARGKKESGDNPEPGKEKTLRLPAREESPLLLLVRLLVLLLLPPLRRIRRKVLLVPQLSTMTGRWLATRLRGPTLPLRLSISPGST